MKVVYASRTGNVQKLIDRLGLEATKIEDGTEKVEGEYLLITYTDGEGLIAAAVSGNSERHPVTFCDAADKLCAYYGTNIVSRFEDAGDEKTDAAILKALR